MLNVDIIAPSMSRFQKFIRLPIPNIFPSTLKYLYWFPVWAFQKNLKKMGVKIRFLNIFDLKHQKLSKIVGFDSYDLYINRNYKCILKKLRKRVDFLIWFDQTDGTGKANFHVLPYVDRFFTKALFRDRTLYKLKFYKNSIFGDYYFRNYEIKNYKSEPRGYSYNPKYEHKIGLSWNFAYSDFRYINKLEQYLYGFTRANTLRFDKPNKDRELLFSANYNIVKNKQIVYFQREELTKYLLKKYRHIKNKSIGRVPKKMYLKNMRNSKAVFSPFGWGELCFRDSEVFITGSALIKPDMGHLETWPNIYDEYKTYIPIPWKIEEWENIIPNILDDEYLLYNIAKRGQNMYKRLWSEEGKKKFCEKFIKMVTPN